MRQIGCAFRRLALPPERSLGVTEIRETPIRISIWVAWPTGLAHLRWRRALNRAFSKRALPGAGRCTGRKCRLQISMGRCAMSEMALASLHVQKRITQRWSQQPLSTPRSPSMALAMVVMGPTTTTTAQRLLWCPFVVTC